jgi:CheY-like chemotaxis protein
LAFSSDFTVTRNIPAPASDWLFASAWLNAMADESGSNPKAGKAQPSSSRSPNIPPESNPRQLNLLLAEDNLPDALLVREAIRLEKLPVEVHVAVDGERAIDWISRAEQDPDVPCPHVFLLDLNLPKADGFEVLRRIRASTRCKDIAVLVVTSSDSPADREMAAKLGAGYFRKPTSLEEFLKIGPVLRRFLEERELL